MTTTTSRGRDPMVVLQSFQEPRSTTNPYIIQLLEGLRQRTPVITFSWRAALFGRWDVVHLHWPEVVFGRDSRAKSAVGAMLFVALLVRARLTGRAIVRTAHNIRPHERADPLARRVLRLCDEWTTLWIRLNPETEHPGSGLVATILHGHYRDWFAALPQGQPRPGRVLFFGQVRPYKGIDNLLAVFAELDDPSVSLRIVGSPNTVSFGDTLAAAAEADPRVGLRLEFIDDSELAGEVSAAELVVLPYQEMHNSGALILALSLERPVLVPDNTVTAALAAEVGVGWVNRFTPELSASDIRSALSATRDQERERALPDLSSRDWPRIVDEHLDAYRQAIGSAKTRPRRARRSPQASRRYSE